MIICIYDLPACKKETYLILWDTFMALSAELDKLYYVTPEPGTNNQYDTSNPLHRKIFMLKDAGPQETLQSLYEMQQQENNIPENAALIVGAGDNEAFFGAYVRHSGFGEAYAKLLKDRAEKGYIDQDVKKGFSGRVHADRSHALATAFFAAGRRGSIVLSEENTLVLHHKLHEIENRRKVAIYEHMFHKTLASTTVPDGDIVAIQGSRPKIMGFTEYTAHINQAKIDRQARAYEGKARRYKEGGGSSGVIFTEQTPVMFITPKITDKNFIGALVNYNRLASFGWAYTFEVYGKFLDTVKNTFLCSLDFKNNLEKLQNAYPLLTATK